MKHRSIYIFFSVLLAILLVIPSIGYGATPDGEDVMEPSQRKKVGLALSGGGAKGVAHIRVIQALEEAGIPIDYIAGTSMGAIVGGLYAIGYTSAELDSLVRTQNWLELLSDHIERGDRFYSERINADRYIARYRLSSESNLVPSGILPGESVLNMLNELTIGYHSMNSFDDLPIPFACVAYDMVRGKEYVARSGSLPMAIRASMSIPGAFMPVEIDSMTLVDGGIYNNFPVDVVRSMGADVVIGIDLFMGPHDAENLQSVTAIFDQITTFLGEEKYNANRADVDLYIRPDMTGYSAASFTPSAIDSILLRGERAARESWDEIIALRRSIGIEEDIEIAHPSRHLSSSDSITIGSIRFEGVNDKESARMMRFLKLKENSNITVGELNQAIDRVRGTGTYSFVTFMVDNHAPYDLTIKLDRKRSGTINVGFRFDSEEMASILLGANILTRRTLASPSATLTIRLSENPYGRVDFSTGSIGVANISGSYMFKANDFAIFRDGNKVATNTFDLHQADLAFTDVRLHNFNLNLGMQYEYWGFHSSLYAEGNGTQWMLKPQSYINYYLTSHYDNLNDYYYPTSGSSMKVDYMLHTTDGVSIDNKLPFMSVAYSLMQAMPISSRMSATFKIHGRTLLGSNSTYPYMNFIGGEMEGRYMSQQMPFVGIRNVEIADNSVMAVEATLALRLWQRHYLRLRGGMLTESDRFLPMFGFEDVRSGYAIEYSYNSPIGPVTLSAGGNSREPWSGLYLSVGKNF